MTDRTDDMTPEEADEVLAAEHALRLLEGEEAEAAKRRAVTDRAFAARVAVWNGRLADLVDEVAPVAPSADARRALMHRLFDEGTATPAAVTAAPRRGFVFWRALAVLGLLGTVVLGTMFYTQTQGPVYVTELTSEDGSFRYLAVINTDRSTLRLVRTDGAPPENGVMELWSHGPDKPPISLGVIPDDPRIEVPVPDVLRPDAGELTIAVSNEPDGGSPTGQPTGPVLAAGVSTDL